MSLLTDLRRPWRARESSTSTDPSMERLVDMLAPDAVRIEKDHAVVDGLQAATLLLADTPASAPATWLDDVLVQSEPCDIALHVTPQSASEAARRLKNRLNALEGARRAAEKEGILPDPARDEAIEQISSLRHRLEAKEGVFATSLYVTTYARNERDRERRLAALETGFGRHQAATKRPTFDTMDALRSTLPAGQDLLGATIPIDGHALSSMRLFTSPTLQMEDGIWFGINRLTGEFVVFDPFYERFDNFNCTVIGKSGGGKGVTLKELALRSLPRGVHHIVLDPANEYVRLAEAIGGQVIRLSPGSPHRINPLDIPIAHGRRDDDNVLSNHIESVQGLLSLLLAGRNEVLSESEKAALDVALAHTYAEAGITDDPATHTRPAPTLADLKAVLDQDDRFDLGLRLARYCTGALRGLFGGTTTIDASNPFTVFAMRELSEDLWPAAMYLVSQHTWRQAFAGDGIPRMITVDECHRLFLEKSGEGDALLSRLIREGRKYLLGTCTASQDPDDYLHTNGGRASVTNANTLLLLKQNEGSIAALRDVIDISEKEETYLLRCTKGQGLLIAQDPVHPGDTLRIPLRVMMSPSHERYVRSDGFQREQGADD